MAVLQAGQWFGPYRLDRLVSRGGMGEVWRAIKTGADGWEKTVALKLILPVLDEDRFAQLFQAEASIAAALDHPNIVGVFGFGRQDGLLYIEMELVHGLDLRHVIERAAKAGAAMPVSLALYVAAEMLKALSYAQERGGGVVHRDIKPHNVLVSWEGAVKLSDFGIAKIAEGTASSQSEVKGTAGYIAPEVLDGAPASARSDLFAVGLVLWECLVGRKLFDGATEAERLRKTFECQVPPVRTLRPDVPGEVETLLMRLLAREPVVRPASAGEALGLVLASPGGRAASSVELKAYLAALMPDEVARAAADSPARRRTPARPSGPPAARTPGSGDGVPREIIDDGPRHWGVPATPARTPTAAGEPFAPEPPRALATRTPRRRRGAVLAGLAVVAVVSVAAALLVRPGRPPAPPLAAAAVVDAAPAPADATAPATGTLVVEVSPPEARVLVDGAALGGSSPHVLEGLPRGRRVVLRVELEGHEPYLAEVVIDRASVRQPVVLAPRKDARTGRDAREPAPTWRKIETPPEPEPADAAPPPASKPPPVTRPTPPPKDPPPRPKPGDDDGTLVPAE